jgi:hypothetical protein
MDSGLAVFLRAIIQHPIASDRHIATMIRLMLMNQCHHLSQDMKIALKAFAGVLANGRTY